jgi:hypothetical protein
MNRRSFLAATGAALAVGTPLFAMADALVGRSLTQDELFATMPAPKPGDWARVIMGSGVQYDKQMGFGVEKTADGDLLFVETQIGEAGGIACNPNTLKKTYVREAHFGKLVTEMDVYAIVARSGNMLTRWADIGGGQTQSPRDGKLRILDVSYLYDRRPMTIRSVSRKPLHVAGKLRETTQVVADFPAGDRLRRLEIWHSPLVPFGVARYRATVADLEPFDLAMRTYGETFHTELTTPLSLLRPLTQSGIAVDPGN